MRNLILALIFAIPVTATAAPLTNQDVITLVRGGLGETTVLQAIDTSDPAFDTSATGLVQLKNGGVSDTIIQRILARASAKPAPAPVAAAAAAAGPGSAPAPTSKPAVMQVAAAPTCPDCGTVQSVREVEKAGQASGGGAVAGGVVGALLGRQVAPDHRRAGTVLGAVGGAVAGHQIEKHAKSGNVWEVTVRFADGTRTFTQETSPGVVAGDRVRVVNGALVRQ